MVMKDKLVKTHHKGPYYTMKKISIGLLALASVTFIIAIPTYISVQNHKEAQTKADAESEQKSSEENLEGLESYQDE